MSTWTQQGSWIDPAWASWADGVGAPPAVNLPQVGAAFSQAASFARSQIRGARFRSTLGSIPMAFGPTGTVQPAADGGGSSIMGFLQPAWDLDTSLGTITLAPWGAPTRNYGPLVLALAAIAAGLGFGLVIRGLRSR
jgi:hypothetical protein